MKETEGEEVEETEGEEVMPDGLKFVLSMLSAGALCIAIPLAIFDLDTLVQHGYWGFVIAMGIIVACFFCYAAGLQSAYKHLREQALLEDDIIRRREGLPPRKKPKGKK